MASGCHDGFQVVRLNKVMYIFKFILSRLVGRSRFLQQLQYYLIRE